MAEGEGASLAARRRVICGLILLLGGALLTRGGFSDAAIEVVTDDLPET